MFRRRPFVVRGGAAFSRNGRKQFLIAASVAVWETPLRAQKKSPFENGDFEKAYQPLMRSAGMIGMFLAFRTSIA